MSVVRWEINAVKSGVRIMMAITWYLVGIIAAGSVFLLIRLSRKYQPGWIILTSLAAGIAMILFCIAWSMGSVLEGVPRAAAMGVVCFGFPGIALLTTTSRLLTTKQRKPGK
jgi:hypothetical protein